MWPLLTKGDTVLLHSDASRTLMKTRMTPVQIVESLMNAVGIDGTVVFPVFFFSWCRGRDFDIRELNGETGVLGNTALKMGAVRSGNPVYSFAAFGKYADLFDVDNGYMLGKGTPFQTLLDLDAKIAAIDVDDNNCMTMYHHVEKMENAKHRFEKLFSGNYTNGETHVKTYSYFVRCEGVITDLAPMEKLLWHDGCYEGNRPFVGDGMRVIWARDLYDMTAAILRANGGENILWRRK